MKEIDLVTINIIDGGFISVPPWKIEGEGYRCGGFPSELYFMVRGLGKAYTTKEEFARVAGIIKEWRSRWGLDKLKEFLDDGKRTLHVAKADGELFPVANIERHPDCPKPFYEAWIRSLTQQ